MSDITISIKDFQSLKNVEIELVPGLNLVVGKTNIGKTAIIRAIDSALFNIGNDDFVRSGQKFCGVSIDNGTHKMTYARSAIGKNEKTAYQFDDGVVQRKVGRTQLEEVQKYFNIRDVRMQNGTKVKLNFWYQNDKPFLMDKTAGQLYEFLSLSSCDKYTKVLKVMQGDEKALKSDIAILTSEIDTYKKLITKKQEVLDKNDGYTKVYESAVILSRKNNKLNSLIRLLKEVGSLRNTINVKKDRLFKINSEIKSIRFDCVSSSYQSVVSTYSTLYNTGRTIAGLRKNLQDIRSRELYIRKRKFSFFDNVDFEFIKGKINSLYLLKQKIGIIDDSVSYCVLNESKIADKTNESMEISNSLYRDLEKDSSVIKNLKVKSKSLKVFFKLLNDVRSVKDKYNKKEETLKSVIGMLKKSEDDFETFKLKAGYCPLCGTIFTKDKED